VIRYTLACADGHTFESWFASSAAYDKQAKRHLIECPVCGSTKVDRAIMAPAIARGRRRAVREGAASEPMMAPPPADAAAGPPAAAGSAEGSSVAMISEHERELRTKLKELHQHLTGNADYVGAKFPEEARRMHYGEADHRSIYGEASLDDAKALHDEGIEFYPLPRLPDDRN
jgi:hypothetical protein